MRRKLTFWRVLAVVVAIIAVLGVVAALTPDSGLTGTGNYIARIKVQGLIRNNFDRVAALERLGKSSTAKAVVVHIDSPGGTTAGSEQLYDTLMRLKEQKPVVVVIDGLGASGAYIAAMASDHIVAQSASLVGSIGVLFQYPNFSELLTTLGIKVDEIKSSPLKAAPSAFQPTSPEAREAIEGIVMDAYQWFRGLVRDRRKLDGAQLDRVADGRVFTGRQAHELRLVDELGDEKQAIAWLAREKQIDANLPVRDYSLEPRLSDLSFIHAAVVGVLETAGLSTFARRIETWGAFQAIDRLNLDGLLALWHPPVTN
jgi:protease-4